MSHFTITTTDHELTLRERAEMRVAVFAALEHEQAGWKISSFKALVSSFGEYAAIGALARVLATPAVAGMLSIVLVVGLGSTVYLGTRESASDVVAREVAGATTDALAALDTNTQLRGLAKSMNDMTESHMAAVPEAVTHALRVIDTSLTGSSVASDVPLARIVAALASLESVAQTHIEEGTGTAADDAVLAFVIEKKSLLELLVSTASDEEKLAIHTAAAEFILDDVRAQNEEQGVFAEAWLATRDTSETATLLDDLSTVKAVAQQTPAQTL